MKIVVDHIKDKPIAIHIDEPVASFPLLAAMQDDKNGSITGNIQGDVTVTREFDTVRVTGRVAAPLALCCSRCLAEFTSFVDTSFTIFFRKEDAATASTEEELELGEMDLLSSVSVSYTH